MKRFQKQFLALCISVSLCSTALAGCGNSSEEAVAQTEATTEAQEATETTQEETTQEAEEATTVTDATDIYVEPVEGISDDFIRGMDASAVLVLENSGVKYYNFDGEEQDVFMTLSEAGVNYIRLRVWNDPYDENGNGYGGGNNDLPTAIELGRRATEYGMKVCIDFHYSDFWADPKRQHAPKAWEGMEIDEKCDALYDYTKDSLTQLLEEGVDVEMVQVGNEINNGMAGEYYLPGVTQLLKSGTKAVREIADTYNKDIQVVIHYTNIESNGEIDSLASNLQNNDVDYDIEKIRENSVFINNIVTHKKFVVHNSATIIGSVKAYKNMCLEENVKIWGNVFCERDLVIGNCCRITGTVFVQGCLKVGNNVVLGEKGKIKSVIVRKNIVFGRGIVIHGFVLTEGVGKTI